MSLFKMIKNSLLSSFRSKIGAMLAMPAFKDIKKSMDYEEYGGAILLGINSIVIKAHGSSNAKAFKNAIRQAKTIYDNKLIESIKEFALSNNIQESED